MRLTLRPRSRVLLSVALTFVVAAFLTGWLFRGDMRRARAHAAQGSVLLQTRCGPIEYQEAGTGAPLLAVHGSGGGHDQGMAFAGALSTRGIRVIAMSRFGYLRTPMPADASATAQADSATAMPAWVETLMMRMLSSDFLFWAALHVSRDTLIEVVLATPPELLKSATAQERARVNAMLDHILPVSARAEGLRSDTAVGKHLADSPLESIHAPTVVVSARDDGYGTYASAQYTASRVAGAKFVGFSEGGHTWVGHNDEVMSEITKLVASASSIPTCQSFARTR